MKIKSKIVVPIELRCYCPTCNEELRSTGRTKMSNPPIYEYKCIKCDVAYESNVVYPQIVHKSIETK